jgi:3-oxoacyl-[acyl-carrier-protein] synthase-3
LVSSIFSPTGAVMSNGALTNDHSPIRRLRGVRIVGTGSYLPENVVTNDDLAALGYDSDWIVQRTGIRERRHAPPEIATSDMAVIAAERAIEAAGIDRRDVDLLLLATMSPDFLLPQTASKVQHELGLNCSAADIAASCAGFMYALVTGMQFVATGCSRYALIIGADTNSRVTNPADRKTFPLFGDGAGATIVTRGTSDQGLLSYTLGSDGAGVDLLFRPAGGVRQPFGAEPVDVTDWYMSMDGRPVFKWAVRMVEESARHVLAAAEFEPDDVKLWVLHQANERILDAVVQSMGIDRRKVVMNLDRYGNTSAGSVPIALDESLRRGDIESDDRLLLCGYGGGLSWGTALLHW